MPTLKEIKAKLGSGASRRGLCNAPHPDEKYYEPQMVPHPEGKQVRNPISKKLEIQYVEQMVATVTCSRFADHDGDHAAFAFSIATPDTWPQAHDDDPPF